jgi:uncharacterized protein YecE (DUF72 family)
MRNKMAKTFVYFEVEHPDEFSPEEVAELLEQLVKVGYADAVETDDDPDLESETAEAIMKMDIEDAHPLPLEAAVHLP